MTNGDGLYIQGGLVRTAASGFWTPSLTAVDPEIPYLPLESPAAPGGAFNAAFSGATHVCGVTVA